MNLYSWFKITSGTASLFVSTTTRIPSLSDSSRRSVIPVIFLSRTRSAIFSTKLALLHWYGNSVITTLSFPDFVVSMCARALIFIFPRPVVYADVSPSMPIISPAVGKSGPFMWVISSSTVIFSLLIVAIIPLIISVRLCGGIFVAIPTAIPSEPLIKRVGTAVGNTVGSLSVSSKLRAQSTVSFSRSFNISLVSFVILDSVYLIAAALSPSTDPKFPWPSTSSYLIEND